MKIINKIRGMFKSAGEVALFQSATLRDVSSNWTKTKFLKINEISLYTNKAISKRAEKVGDIKFIIKNAKGDEINTPESQKLLALLNQPSKNKTKSEFFSLYQKYKDITGSVYILIVTADRLLRESTKIEELKLLRPDLVEQQFDNDGVLTGYIYTEETGKSIKYLPDEIIASHYYDPLNPEYGISLLRAGAKAINTENQLADYNENVLRNGGKIEGILSFETENITKSQIEEAKKVYAQQYSDAKRTGIPLFLGGKASYQNLALNPVELSYLESKGVTLNDICILTDVPKIMLATVDGVKFDNANESRRMFLSDVIAPLHRNLTSKLTQSKRLSGELVISYADPTPENVDMKLKENEVGIKNYYMTINEARHNVNLEPIDGGDKLMVPFGIMPKEDDKKEEKKTINKSFEHPLRDKEFRKKYGELKVAKEIKNEKIFEKFLNIYFKEQKERIIEKIEPIKQFKRKNIIDDVFGIENEIKISAKTFLPLLTSFLKEAGDDTYKLLGNSRFEFRLDSNIASWLDKKVDIFSRQINDTTFNKLKEEFGESLNQEETRAQLINRIQNTYKDGGKVISKGRAGTIARTETGGVMTKGTFEAYKQADIPIKIWVTVGDKNVRDSHAMQDGEERPLNQAFSNGLDYPRQAGMPADEVINCRCQV